MDQARAMRERKFLHSASAAPTPTTNIRKPKNATETAHVKNEARSSSPIGSSNHICPTCGQPLPKRGFDKRAYQREYMRKRRAKAKDSGVP